MPTMQAITEPIQINLEREDTILKILLFGTRTPVQSTQRKSSILDAHRVTGISVGRIKSIITEVETGIAAVHSPISRRTQRI